MEFLKNWDFSRIFKLLAGATAIILAIVYNWLLIGILGGLFLFQAITNTGCGMCSSSQCSTGNTNNKQE